MRIICHFGFVGSTDRQAYESRGKEEDNENILQEEKCGEIL